MDAEDIEKDVADVDNFGAIVDELQLRTLKILSLPVYLVIHVKGHWIGIFMNKKCIEIMDSDGYLGTENVSPAVCSFVCAHALGKSLLVTPRLQTNGSSLCGLFVIVFIWFRQWAAKSLCDFVKGFSRDLDRNEKFICELYEEGKKLKK